MHSVPWVDISDLTLSKSKSLVRTGDLTHPHKRANHFKEIIHGW